MRFFKMLAAPLVILLLSLLGCGGGGGGGSSPAPAGDTAAPTVSISAPANNVQVRGITTVSANATDNVAVTKVEFFLNGDLKATSSSAPYSFNLDTASLSRGSYTLSAKAYDAAGNIGQSASVVVTVPITVSMSTSISGATAVGTVFLAGLSAPEVFGLNLSVSTPAGAGVTTATPSGVAGTAFSPFVNGPVVVLASSNGFGSGEVMKITFDNVPAGAVPADFNVSLSAVFGAGGVQIQ